MKKLTPSRNGDRPPVKRREGLGLLVLVGWVLGTAVASAVTIGLTQLLRSDWPWKLQPADTPPGLLDILKVGLSVVAGMGGIVALVVAYRRQQHLERDEAGHRDEQKAFRDRYAAAATQLGDREPAVRLAGVYAMANLADDWDNQRQQCVDVLCAYLRLPWTDEPGTIEPTTTATDHTWTAGDSTRKVTRTYTGRAGERETRRTLTRVIATHLQPDAPTSWSHLELNLRSAHLPDADLTKAIFKSTADFSEATFSGTATFLAASFSGPANFASAVFSGAFSNFTRAVFSGALTFFSGAAFSGQRVSFDGATFSGELTYFDTAVFSGEAISFYQATISGPVASFTEATFSGQRAQIFNSATIHRTDLSRAEFGVPPAAKAGH